MARRLVQAGVRFVTLTYGGWDFHSSLEVGMKRVLPVVDSAVATLVDDLEMHGMLDSTVVLVMGSSAGPRGSTKGWPASTRSPDATTGAR